MLYILVDNIPVITHDINLWSSLDRSIRKDSVDDASISTVFLGISHGERGGIPILFETMVFGGELDGYQERYCTIEESIKGHQVIYDMVDKGRTKRADKINIVLDI